jgi:hypothetical protein
MFPPNIPFQNFQQETKWLLTGVSNGIDLRRMSIAAGRRDFPADVSGSHMAWQDKTCFTEVPFDRAAPPPFTYLLTFKGELNLADLRSVGGAAFSGNFYGTNHEYSREVFLENIPEYTEAGCHGFLRYSAPALAQTNSHEEVVALFPSARQQLSLVQVEPIGSDSPPVPINLFDGSIRSSDEFYTTLEDRNLTPRGPSEIT